MNATEQSEQPGTADEVQAEDTGLASLASLLAADTQDDNTPGGEAAESSGDAEKTKPVTKFNDLAGATGLDLDALYNLEVTLSEGGDPVTIEQLKDQAAKSADLDLRELQFEEQRTERESELMRAESELKAILERLPASAVKPEVLDAIRERTDRVTAAERQKTLEVIPQWADDEQRTQELRGIAEHLGGYGFDAQYLNTVVDHRLFKYMRDNMLREKRVREALAKVKPGKPEPTQKPKAGQKPPKKAATTVKKGSNHASKLETLFSNL